MAQAEAVVFAVGGTGEIRFNKAQHFRTEYIRAGCPGIDAGSHGVLVKCRVRVQIISVPVVNWFFGVEK